ncbi:hypothetical protein Cni_G17563 [Canna indica]|uniref:Uncharacterized protein n=1 Tax=Canna indica TaxID=4628 RepID=A0AAQ3KJF7_9LILI|nr:hypothetical protein Cni_G17563 [Canna indica]
MDIYLKAPYDDHTQGSSFQVLYISHKECYGFEGLNRTSGSWNSLSALDIMRRYVI